MEPIGGLRPGLQVVAARFQRARGGNVAITFALALVPMLLLIGGSVDLVRALSAASTLQSAVDSAALAAANLRYTNSPTQTAQSYVEINSEDLQLANLQVTVSETSAQNFRDVTVSVSADLPTTFLGMIGINAIPIAGEARGKEAITNVEISLVLDVSSSMNGARISKLRTAAKAFVQQVLADEYVDTTTLSLVPYGGTVRLPPSFHSYLVASSTYTQPVNGYALPVPASASTWNGCLEMSASEVRSVPLTTASLGVLPTFTIWTASNPWCPSSSNATSVFLSNDRTALSNRIDTFSNSTLSDGTGTDVGTSWGVRALDPSWRGKLGAPSSASSRPSDYVDTETRKFLIIMTDGGISGQLRPKAGWTPSGPAHVGAGGSSFVYSRASALASFYELCDYAKGKGVSVYTIAFMVTDTGINNEMRNCASNASQFYNVDLLDIDSAFASIASQISALRLVN
jgi:Flp pilus assembly protein TadG